MRILLLLVAITAVTSLFFLVRALRTKRRPARDYLQEARAHGTMFLVRPFRDLDALYGSQSAPGSVPPDKNYWLRSQQAGASYRHYQALLHIQAQFELQNTIELPIIAPQEGPRETEPIRAYPLVRDTEGMRSFPSQVQSEKKRR